MVWLVTVATCLYAQEKPKQQKHLFAASHHRTFPALVNEPVNIQVDAGSVYAKGSWIALDEHSTLPGPSVSEILCEKSSKVCHELQSNIVIMDDMFTLNADSVDYPITRWNEKELVAQTISGICRVLHTLKFDLENKTVYLLDSLSEPTEDLPKTSRDACNAVGLRLELRGETTYSIDAR